MLTDALFFFLEGNVVIFGRMSFSKGNKLFFFFNINLAGALRQKAFIFILYLSVQFEISHQLRIEIYRASQVAQW